MRRRIAVLALALLTQQAQAATLVHSNDVLGDIEACGCRTNPLGGIARKANWLKKLDDDSLLQLDAGDLLFSTDKVPELLRGQAELQARYLLRSLDGLKHDAVVPGEKDFAIGLAAFEKLRKATKIRFLAANLVRRNGQALFEKSAVFTRKGADGKPLRIAVVGIVGDDLPYPRELKALPALAVAKKEVAAVRNKADLVVLLTHVGFDKDKELAQQVQGVDLIVGGHTQTFLQQPLRIGNVTIYQSSFRNQYVGAIPLAKPFTGESYRLTALDTGYDSPESNPSATDKLVAEFKKALGDLNSRESARLEKLTSRSAFSSGTKFHTFAKCAECHVKQFDFWRQTRHALALGTLIEKQQFKNKECLGCHTVGLGDKQGFSNVNRIAEYKKAPPAPAPLPDSPDADAEPGPLPIDEPVIESLPAEELAAYLKSVHDAKSLKDKVRITQIEPEQTVRRSVSSLHVAWAPVQCENCHAPGRDHPFSGKYSKKVETSACLKCHTLERAPEWYTSTKKPDLKKIETKRTLVACPAGDLSEAEE